MQWCAFLLQLDFHDFLGVVPGASRVGHEDGLIQTESGDGNEIADKKERLDECKRQRGEKYSNENVEHPFLRVLRADFHNFLAVRDARRRSAFQLDVGLDEFHGTIGAGSDRLRARASKPIDDCAAGDEPEDKRRVEQRKFVHIGGEAVGQRHDNGKNHRGCADDGRADQNRLRGGFERVARAVVGFEHVLGALEIHVKVVVLLQFLLDAGDLLDE